MGTCKMKKCALLNLLPEREGTIQDQIPRGHTSEEFEPYLKWAVVKLGPRIMVSPHN